MVQNTIFLKNLILMTFLDEGEILISDTMRLMAVLAKTNEIEAGMTAYRTVQDWNRSKEARNAEHLCAVARALMDVSLEAVTEILTTTSYNEDQLIAILTAVGLRPVDAKDVKKIIIKERNRRK